MTAKEFMEGIQEQDSRVRMMREELHTVRERLDIAAMRLKAASCINRLENKIERDILHRWYLLFQNEDEIMKITGYGRTSVYTYRRNGLEHLKL